MSRSKTFAQHYPSDRNFFLVMLLIIWAGIISGFGYEIVQRSAKGTLHYPLIIHLHAAFFVGWLALFTIQLWLVRGNYIKLHKKLGITGFIMVPVMVILGIYAALVTEEVKYGTPDFDPGFLATMFADMVVFGVLAGLGMCLRKEPASHKRLLFIATAAIADAGFGRWFSFKIAPIAGDFYWNIHNFAEGIIPYFVFQMLPALLLILAIGVYDLITRKRLHHVYIWALVFWLCVNLTGAYLYFNAEWIRMVTSMIRH